MPVTQMSFWKYFWSKLKESKYLLLNQILSAVLMAIISVLANLLDIYQLTYLNVFISINCFASLIGFGISIGIGIFINQNIKDAKKVNKFAFIGFVFCLILGVLSVTALIAFPDLIMHRIMSFEAIDNTFYYIMSLYFIFTIIREYFEWLLTEIGNFKATLLWSCIPLLVIILGSLILYFAGAYFLNYIAIFYVVSALMGCVTMYFALLKNKGLPINVFHFTKFKLTKKQWEILINNFLIQFVWQVGYYAVSVFLLRMDEGIFNTYSYLENVLDVFNGFFFAYIITVQIQITRSLGEKDYDAAYTHGKYSLIGACVIWVFYFICSMALIYPVALGVNDAYFSIMFIATISYVIMHLVRFVSWDFGSYILVNGGQNKAVLTMQILATIWQVGICFIVPFLPVNIPLAYFLITIPDIIMIPVFTLIFIRKKWMKNVNEDTGLLRNKVKVIIFDFDDTLYYNVDWSFWYQRVKDFFNIHFAHLSAAEREDLLKKANVNFDKLTDFDICNILLSQEGSAEAWFAYRESFSLSEEEKNATIVPQETLEEFSGGGGISLYIVSNSRLKEIQNFAAEKGIDLSLFKDVYVNDFTGENGSKAKYYQKIMEIEGVEPKQVLVIGDSYRNDIMPAKRLHMNYYQCADGFTYEEVMEN